jgi:hypothetical protein
MYILKNFRTPPLYWSCLHSSIYSYTYYSTKRSNILYNKSFEVNVLNHENQNQEHKDIKTLYTFITVLQ